MTSTESIPAFQEDPNKSKSSSYQMSKMVGEFVKGAYEGELKKVYEMQEKQHDEQRRQTELIMEVKDNQHTPPCKSVLELKAEMDLKYAEFETRHSEVEAKIEALHKDLKKEEQKEEKAEERKAQLVVNVKTAVLVAVILGVLGLAIFALQSGARPSGITAPAKAP